MKTEDRPTCPSCGNEFSGAMEFCPVCTLRKAVKGGIESGGFSFNDTLMPATEQAAQRFEHYDLVKDDDGKPVGVDLHCPVTLKLINERYIGDESARLRFLREARAAASLVTRMWPRFSI